jgi:nucleotide-binding universal stress UspA family protein
MNNKLLVLTDFSEGSNNALNYALNLAKEMSMILILMNIIKDKQDVQTASEKMEDTSRLAMLKEPDLKIISIVELILSEKNINDIIDREKIGIIIIGTEGVSGLKPVVMGSFANGIISISKCPVIAVPIEGKYTGIRNVLVLSELNLEEIDSIKYIMRITKDFNARITFFNVENNKEGQQTKSENFKNSLHELTGYISFDIVLDNSFDIIHSVEKYVNKAKPDLIATLGKDQISFEGLWGKRLTKMLCLQTLVPILSLPHTSISDPTNEQFRFIGRQNR